jgi:hypothetical protein
MQSDIAQSTFGDLLARCPEHRLGDVDRHDPAMLADRLSERQGQRTGAAADFEHALAAAETEPRHQ